MSNALFHNFFELDTFSNKFIFYVNLRFEYLVRT